MAYFNCSTSAKVTNLCYDTSKLPNRDIQVIYMLAQVFWQVFWHCILYSMYSAQEGAGELIDAKLSQEFCTR
jgi:hypothetical protein